MEIGHGNAKFLKVTTQKYTGNNAVMTGNI